MGSDDDVFIKLNKAYFKASAKLDRAYERGRAAERASSSESNKGASAFDLGPSYSYDSGSSTYYEQVINLVLILIFWGGALFLRAIFFSQTQANRSEAFWHLLTPGGWWIGGWIISALYFSSLILNIRSLIKRD